MAPRAHSSRMTVISRTTRFSSSAPLSPVDPHWVVQGWSSPADLLAYLHSCLRPPWPLIRRAGNTARGPLPLPCGGRELTRVVVRPVVSGDRGARRISARRGHGQVQWPLIYASPITSAGGGC